MKKIITVVLLCVAVMTLGACGKSEDKGAAGKKVSTVEILETVWASYGDDEKFPIGGGDSANMVMDAPGTFDAANAEELDATLAFPAAQASAIDEAASMMHMMNANTFTCGVYHVADVSNVKTVADAVKDNIMNRQWMCGFPDIMIIASVEGEQLVAAFGNAEVMENFKTKLTAAYENTEIIYEEGLN